MDSTYQIMGMPGVGWFGFLVIGLLAGWIAERTTNRDHGFLKNILVGIVGSVLGGYLAQAVGVEYYGFWGNLVVAAIGAIILLFVVGMLRSRT